MLGAPVHFVLLVLSSSRPVVPAHGSTTPSAARAAVLHAAAVRAAEAETVRARVPPLALDAKSVWLAKQAAAPPKPRGVRDRSLSAVRAGNIGYRRTDADVQLSARGDAPRRPEGKATTKKA